MNIKLFLLFIFLLCGCGHLNYQNSRSLSSTISHDCLSNLDRLLGSSVSIVKKLKEMPIEGDIRRIVAGDNSVYLVTLQDGTRAVFKPEKQDRNTEYLAEIAAYEISDTFGFDLVPPTVERNVFGEVGSLQLFIERAKDGYLAELTISDEDYHKNIVFDYLLAEYDRHPGNILIDPELNLFLIDHGFSFISRLAEEDDLRIPNYVIESLNMPELEIIKEKIVSISDDDLFNLVGELPLEMGITFFKRFGLLKKQILGHSNDT